MCMPATCPTCNKTTWRGCGKHIASVMDKVPVEERCQCPRAGAGTAPAAARASSGSVVDSVDAL
ncbi:hypothetical protein BCR35DRAFT_308022 [Leucosporidium creatinivorum]|uniref:Uncharacterized protein n=1 Tax=Leucosporidium creatinivorum TaxID=106004 RepID=A0A1Y2EDU5_9BASI|nr:hypothetical protein BCR35DRAFT_308022 [Leucosporidium creatinivorum]